VKANLRSPIKDNPLRNPGQSLDKALFNLNFDKILTPFTVLIFALILAGLEWWR
jgi:hypothetical protein